MFIINDIAKNRLEYPDTEAHGASEGCAWPELKQRFVTCDF